MVKISKYLNDMATPLIDYTDPAPIISGKADTPHAADMSFNISLGDGMKRMALLRK